MITITVTHDDERYEQTLEGNRDTLLAIMAFVNDRHALANVGREEYEYLQQQNAEVGRLVRWILDTAFNGPTRASQTVEDAMEKIEAKMAEPSSAAMVRELQELVDAAGMKDDVSGVREGVRVLTRILKACDREAGRLPADCQYVADLDELDDNRSRVLATIRRAVARRARG